MFTVQCLTLEGVFTLTHFHITLSQNQRISPNLQQIMANQNKHQPLRIPQLQPIPSLDVIQGLMEEAEKRGVTRSFTAWSGVISNKLASHSEENFPSFFVTISDPTWSNHIQSGKDNKDIIKKVYKCCTLIVLIR